MFALVQRRKAYVQVAEQIIQAIARGEFGVGDRLPSVKVLEGKLGVSRATIREALSALELAQIVAVSQGRGTCVTRIPQSLGEETWLELDHGDSPGDVLEMRLILEPEAARLAAQRATDEDLQALTTALDVLRAAVRDKVDARGSDVDFHIAVATASGNSVIQDIVRGVARYLNQALWRSLRERSLAEQDLMPTYVEQHTRTLTAIRARDGQAAAQSMRDHLQHVWRVILVNPNVPAD